MVEVPMGLNIKNPALEADIRELATLTGESLTDAIAVAVRERRARLGNPPLTAEAKLAVLRGIQERLRDAPGEHRTSSMDEFYDEHGLPK